jgi:hypothetical protein
MSFAQDLNISEELQLKDVIFPIQILCLRDFQEINYSILWNGLEARS